MRRLIPLFVLLALAGCETNHNFSPQRVAAGTPAIDLWRSQRAEMLRRHPPENPGSEEDRRATARELAETYAARRSEFDQSGTLFNSETYVTQLVGLPIEEARFRQAAQERERERARANQAREEVAALDGRPVTPADIARIVRRRAAEAASQGASRDPAASEAELRQQIVAHRAAMAGQAAAARERELTRLSATNLADMPREIARAAEDNLRDARSPFDTRPAWRPTPDALRAEEVRLRDAIIARVQSAQRDARMRAEADAMAARREAILQSCRMQAALMGAAVPNPYMGRGLGGAIASGVAGALQQAATEANALQSCLRASGL